MSSSELMIYGVISLTFIVPLVLTWLIEWLAAWFMDLRGKRVWLVLLLMNVITNPATNYLVLRYGASYPSSLTNGLALLSVHTLLIELGVVVVESLLLMYSLRLPMRRAAALSFVMNFASFVAGLGLFWLYIRAFS